MESNEGLYTRGGGKGVGKGRGDGSVDGSRRCCLLYLCGVGWCLVPMVDHPALVARRLGRRQFAHFLPLQSHDHEKSDLSLAILLAMMVVCSACALMMSMNSG